MATERRRCSLDGCDRPHVARGLCQTHYSRWKRSGDAAPDVPVQSKEWRGQFSECRVDGCDRPPKSRGWCNTHYHRWRSTGDVQPDTPIQVQEWRGCTSCRVEGCPSPVKATGYCSAHYQMWKKHGDPTIKMRPAKWDGICSVPECDRPIKIKGWCEGHWKKARTTGTIPTGPLPGKGHRRGQCAVCDRGLADRVNWMLISEEGISNVASTVGVSRASVDRHRVNCLGLIKEPGVGLCLICIRDDVEEIEEAVEATSAHRVAKEMGISRSGLYKHMAPKHQRRRARYEMSRLNAAVRVTR